MGTHPIFESDFDCLTDLRMDFVEKEKGSAPVVMFSKDYCPFCKKAINALKQIGQDFKLIELTKLSNADKIQDALLKLTGGRSVPRVFIHGKFFGGGDETAAGCRNGTFQKKVAAGQ